MWKEDVVFRNFKQTSQGKFPYPSMKDKNWEVMIELEDIATVCVMDLSVWETCVGLEGNDNWLNYSQV